jgi:hypothetical protein
MPKTLPDLKADLVFQQPHRTDSQPVINTGMTISTVIQWNSHALHTARTEDQNSTIRHHEETGTKNHPISMFYKETVPIDRMNPLSKFYFTDNL